MVSKKPDPRGEGLAAAQLRQLWEQGQRREALRGALARWAELLQGAESLDWLQEACRISGLDVESFAVHVQMARRRANTREWTALIRRVLPSDPWWACELLREAGSGSRDLETLRIEAELALGNVTAIPALVNAWVQAHSDAGALDAAVDWLVRSGAIGDAERLVERSPGLTVWRARLAIWRKHTSAAVALLEELPASPEVACLRAVAAIQQGRLHEAEVLLRPLLESDVRVEAGTWLATVLRKQERHAEALHAAQAASVASPRFNLVARLERELAAHYAPAKGSTASASWLSKLLRVVRYRSESRVRESQRMVGEMEHADALYSFGLKHHDPLDRVLAVLERFGGNHTLDLTTLDNGRLNACPLPVDPRYLGAGVQLVMWTRGADAARTLYRDHASKVANHPLFRIYHGELELWMGVYDEAERIFRDILAATPKVLWAWIGLGASLMFQGRLQKAQDIWREGVATINFVGPTLYVYRGECYRRQGEFDKARHDLETAVCEKPQRLSAWINLALLNGDSEQLREVEGKCTDVAPVLMEELSGSPTERLEKALHAMRGNRSSYRVSYHLWGRLWSHLT
jgi:tetratricopeptide (TPR) repeat protein